MVDVFVLFLVLKFSANLKLFPNTIVFKVDEDVYLLISHWKPAGTVPLAEASGQDPPEFSVNIISQNTPCTLQGSALPNHHLASLCSARINTHPVPGCVPTSPAPNLHMFTKDWAAMPSRGSL